ncbi:unnamed protein product [Vitrella brassicaformis CCMP3155]|uniref:Ubiquitin-like domain-containing protein n=2 Tax=Vitrella brassicaformis TaxID=1169539 RepID=A0A0G4G426_VITBC|nr:unnamed protein product [Vitrella brassicaformis CCMP3155]|mmetsp:Transcript_40096/g.100358  ORF Transcript_40096/g.100358 Transcript_40096/m.100358 type:complete len:268 (+) Transcript_40096:136-939(+)|eukprot:CEM23162.1 unnamed protein product [Vitrella brassicaformis CCMP3155]
MKLVIGWTALVGALCAVICSVVADAEKVVSVRVAWRGRKMRLSGDTVSSLREQLAKKTGLDPAELSLKHQGRLLKPEDLLADAGVKDSDILEAIKVANTSPEFDTQDAALPSASAVDSVVPSGSGGSLEDAMQNPMAAVNDPSKMMELLGNKDLADQLFTSCETMLNDPKKLEEMRQMMLKALTSPMMKGRVPREQLAPLRDPKKFKLLMQEQLATMKLISERQIKAKQAMEASAATNSNSSDRRPTDLSGLTSQPTIESHTQPADK